MNEKFKETLARIESATGIKTMTELGRVVGSSQQYVSKKSKEGEFPPNWAFEIAKKYKISTDWILTGEEPPRLGDIKGDFTFYEELEVWARETGRSDDIQWMRNQIESFFPMFKEWKAARGKTLEENAELKKQANGGGWK